MNDLPALPWAFAVALVIDQAFGEAPNAIHPVAWLGRCAAPLRFATSLRSHLWQFVVGTAAVLVIVSTFVAVGAWIVVATSQWPVLQFLVLVWLLKSTFAVRGLGAAALRVRDHLHAGDIGLARYDLRSLCSRDASGLTSSELVEGAVESLAENASDSAVAPFVFLAVFGLPGALCYRAINTLDAMFGYRGAYEYVGKAAAKIDDVVNWVPARLTAWSLLVVGRWRGYDATRARALWLRDADATPSPNAGQPMAAMAGLLGIALGKPGVYRLGDATRSSELVDIQRAWSLAREAMWLVALLTLMILTVRAS